MSPPQEINILLLGETGVGKSTFINSIANYLNFGDFDEAVATEKLLILIPCVVTVTNENYESRTIKVGSDKNEYQEVGAAGTQDVKTYVFPINEGRTRIRLIDSPGMGDPRGIEQDDQNCESILAYLSNLKELHAICFFMRPTTTRKTILFEYCVKQILSKLEKSASRNIVFIFTNTRGSNYTPGDTVPCLKTIIDEIKSKPPHVEIPLGKDNIFSLDNEAFRFLIATRNNFNYSEDEQARFIDSWYRSASECGRLITYIVGDDTRPPLAPHQLQSTISVNEARRIITHLSQPLSEITQLIQDNIRIAERHKQNLNVGNKSLDDLKKQLYIPIIKLEVKELSQPVTVCTAPKCTEVVQVEGTSKKWHYKQRCHNPCYLKNVPKEFIGDENLRSCAAMNGGVTCKMCECSYKLHMHIYYETEAVDDKIVDKKVMSNIQEKEQAVDQINKLITDIDTRKRELEEERELIVKSTAQFAYFLQQNAISPYNDSYRAYIQYLINREKSLGRSADPEVIRNLQKLLSQYEEIKLAYEKSLTLSKNCDESLQVTAQDVLNSINKLYKLKHNGQKIQELFTKQKSSRQYEYDKSCEYIHPKNSSLKMSKKNTAKGGNKSSRFGFSWFQKNQQGSQNVVNNEIQKRSEPQKPHFLEGTKNKREIPNPIAPQKSHFLETTNGRGESSSYFGSRSNSPLPDDFYDSVAAADTVEENYNGESQTVNLVTQEKITDALAYMIATDMMPYDTVEKDGFKFFMKTLIPSYNIPSKITIMEEKIMDLYVETKNSISKDLRKTNSVCLTVDCWTSISGDSYLTLTAHYIDNQWNIKSACLGCRYVADNQTAEYLCEIIRDTLDQYDLTRKVIACTSDGKDNLLIEAIEMLHFNHITCLGDSINSVIRQSIEIDEIKNTLIKAEDIYKFFSKSSKACREFNKIQQVLGVKGKSFPIYSSKKWWSVLQLLEFCQEQHKAFVSFAKKDQSFKQYNNLSQEDLDFVKTIMDCIEPLINISEGVASENVTSASIILPIVRQILKNAKQYSLQETSVNNEQATDSCEESDETEKQSNKEMCDAMTITTQFSKTLHEIFAQRYTSDSETCNMDRIKNTLSFLLKAMFLDPRFKDNHPEVAEIYESLKDESKEYIVDEPVKVPKKKSGLASIFGVKQEPAEVKKESLISKEIELYTNLKNVDVTEDPLTWWKNNESRFPHLAFLARKYLAGQAASGPSDRIFLKNGEIGEDARVSLTGQHVEQMVYISLNKNYFIQQYS